MSKVKNTPAEASPILNGPVAGLFGEQPSANEPLTNDVRQAAADADRREDRDWRGLQAEALSRIWTHPADDIWNDA